MKGLRVLVTRPAPDNQQLAELLRHKGAIPILCPTLEIVPLDCASILQTITATLNHYTAAIFVSRAAASQVLPYIMQYWSPAARQRLIWAAMGAGCAQALQAAGITNIVYPSAGIGGAALLPMLLPHCPPQSKVVIFKGEGGLPELQTGLRTAQIEITEINCYRRVKLDITPDVAAALDQYGVDVMIATSGESLAQLRHMLEKWPQILSKPLIVVSSRLRELALQLGFIGPIIITTAADNQTIVTAISNIN